MKTYADAVRWIAQNTGESVEFPLIHFLTKLVAYQYDIDPESVARAVLRARATPALLRKYDAEADVRR